MHQELINGNTKMRDKICLGRIYEMNIKEKYTNHSLINSTYVIFEI